LGNVHTHEKKQLSQSDLPEPYFVDFVELRVSGVWVVVLFENHYFYLVRLLAIEQQVVVFFNFEVIAALKGVEHALVAQVILEDLFVLASEGDDSHSLLVHDNEVVVLFDQHALHF
jgi:hypothetical protein